MQENINNYELIYDYLRLKYKRAVIGKKEVAHELGISPSSLDLRISKGINLPKYKKDKGAKNAPVTFTIVNVAKYLSDDDIETI